MRALVLLGTLALATGPALGAPARPSLTQVLRGEALEYFEIARQDFKAQRFQQALSGFLRAWALSREPRLRWNAAVCLRRLERNAEALRTLDAYLAEAGAELTAEELEEARRAQEALRALVAVASLSVVPGDVEVSVDGALLPGPSLEVVYLEPGPHVFLAEKAGHQPQLARETLRAGQRFEWRVTLLPAPSPAREVTGPVVAPAPVAVAAPPAPPVPARPRWAPWVTAGGGAAAAAVGGVLLGVAAVDYQQLRQTCGTSCAPTRWGPSRDAEVAGAVLLGVGSAVAAVGLAWGLFGAVDGAGAEVALGPGHLSLEVRF